jgi:CRP-like cAMP-binding protein
MMSGGRASRPTIHTVRAGEVLVEEAEEGTDVFLVLDGVIRIEKGGQRLAEFGPGAVLGERAGNEDGARTSSIVAVTDGRVAAVPHAALDGAQLHQLSQGHRREESGG